MVHGPGKFERGCLLGLGLLTGFASSVLAPSCIIPDYCIVINTDGTDWCMLIEDAQMWPVGQPELAGPVSAPGGGPPKGCHCFNDGEVVMLDQHVPAEAYAVLVAQLEEDARVACAWAVPAGYDHSCFINQGPLAPVFSDPYSDGSSFDCVGSCGYANPPPFGSCGDDPNPWECNDDDAILPGTGETGTDTSGDTDDPDPGFEPGINSGNLAGRGVAR